MGKYHPALEWGLGIIYLALIIWGLWNLGGWLSSEAMSLTPKKLAIACIVLTAIPLALLLIFGIAGQQNAMTVFGALTVLAFSISGLGLFISSVWYLLSS